MIKMIVVIVLVILYIYIYIDENKEYKIDDIPCVEMTLEEVCKALGKNIKIIKGETK